MGSSFASFEDGVFIRRYIVVGGTRHDHPSGLYSWMPLSFPIASDGCLGLLGVLAVTKVHP